MDRTLWTSEPRREVAMLIGVRRPGQPEWEVQDTLDELAELADTAGVAQTYRTIVRLREPDAATWVGKGKIVQIAEETCALGATLLIFDDDLTPAQARNIEAITHLRVVDRTQLILDIFAQRARSSEGRLQIELAQLEYLRPRLRHRGGELEQQRGGIGLRGPGETQLELDRRRIDRRIARIREELERVRQRRSELRRGRRRHGWALVCLVGYTNAGKSSLLNALCGASVYADDRLFATLDPTTRRLELPNHQPALLTDTVGFIRKLPHRLVEAFHATLEEVVRADLLLHVVDAGHPRAEDRMAAVAAVLKEIGADTCPQIVVFNKLDMPGAPERARGLGRLVARWVGVSARTGQGLDELRAEVADMLRERGRWFRARVPVSDGRTLALIHEVAAIQSERVDGSDMIVEGRIPPGWWGAVVPYLIGEGEASHE